MRRTIHFMCNPDDVTQLIHVYRSLLVSLKLKVCVFRRNAKQRKPLNRDGTQSWVVISRGVDKYVTKFALDHKQPMHHDERFGGAGKLVAINSLRVQSQASSSSSSMRATLSSETMRWGMVHDCYAKNFGVACASKTQNTYRNEL